MITPYKSLLLLVGSLVACGETTTEGDRTGYQGPIEVTMPDGAVLLEPLPPPSGQQLTSERFTVPPGEEKYYCYSFRSPADGVRAITEIQPLAGGLVHHEVVFQTLVDEPEGFFECPVQVKATWQPIWAGGAGARGLKLPEGVAFKIPPNTQYLVQYHLLNADTQAATSRAALNFSYGGDAEQYQAAGLFALGSFSLEIPASTSSYQLSVQCNAHKELKVFAAFPHLHELGKRVTFETGASEATAAKAYEIAPWTFGDQPMEPVDFTIRDGDFMRATCEWSNPTSRAITYGESTKDEMCFMILFYYPFDQLDGCLD